MPLALDTRETWPIWAELHGYSQEQAAQLIEAVRSLVASKHYQEALVNDLAERVDCDGVVTGLVSDGHRASAALALFARALNKANGQPKPRQRQGGGRTCPSRCCCRYGQYAEADTGHAGQGAPGPPAMPEGEQMAIALTVLWLRRVPHSCGGSSVAYRLRVQSPSRTAAAELGRADLTGLVSRSLRRRSPVAISRSWESGSGNVANSSNRQSSGMHPRQLADPVNPDTPTLEHPEQEAEANGAHGEVWHEADGGPLAYGCIS